MTANDKERLESKYMLRAVGLGVLMGFVGVGAGWDFISLKIREKQIYAKANELIETKCAEKAHTDKILHLRFETSNGVHTLNCLDFSKQETCTLDSVAKRDGVSP
jgi:hypothetical protein